MQNKNKLMIWLSFGAILLGLLVHLLHREFNLFGHSMMGNMSESMNLSQRFSLAMNILFIIPVALLVITSYYYRKQADHPKIPLFNMLTLTFSSISIIAGGGGTVEFHFSIFMVAAIIAYYEDIKLIAVMTIIFALQHLAGFFFIPELVFGVAEYPFLMMVIHAVFLVFTSAATSLQIISKKKYTEALESEKAKKQTEVETLLETVKNLSRQLEQTSLVVTAKSEGNIIANNEMLTSFKEVSTGLETQSESLNKIDENLQGINRMIQINSQSFSILNEKASITDNMVQKNQNNIEPLFEQVRIVSDAINRAAITMQTLNESSHQVENIIFIIQDVARQTNLLALNASIEAARAGEYGRGFAVVASEIRKLSEQSNHATEEIVNILSNIQRESTESVTQIEVGKQAAGDTVELAERSFSSFKQMNRSINEMIEIIEKLNESVKQIESQSEKISNEMTNISAITEQSVASVEQLFSITETQTSTSNQINRELIRLKELSETLQAQFSAS
ncbi:methyl-accepting chemotaxis protein [Ferviditalea candida]|uniref:Methyl-accepting chemotaxis protein n=1 Tax=Ferviditalea candida TaxID=3108399 RepID=A0ABU5ZKD5_9BACL|nr:methyl-accepting chemotaxis protein [Paenibacillaceae bacterium T2]